MPAKRGGIPAKRGGGNVRGRNKAPPEPRSTRARKRARIEVDDDDGEVNDCIEVAASSQEDDRGNNSSKPFKFNLTVQLTMEQRLAWGIPKRFRYLVVNITAETDREKTNTAFCVHCVPELKEAEQGSHRPWYSQDSMPDSPVCFGETNLLTHDLCRELHSILAKNPPNSAELHSIIMKSLDLDLTAVCIICKSDLGTKVWRPVACSAKCEEAFQLWPLEARFSPLLRDSIALDFLLCCVYTMHAGVREPEVPQLAPFRTDILLEVLNSFPEITEDSSLAFILGTGRLAIYRAVLLDWLCTTFKGALLTAAPKDQVPQFMPEKSSEGTQFILLNSDLARQKAFSAACRAPGIAGFHGTTSNVLFPILSSGLKDKGIGVWYAQDPSTSLLGYMRGELWKWPKSAFNRGCLSGCKSVLFGLELCRGTTFPQRRTGSTSTPSNLMIRYVFVMSQKSVAALSQSDLRTSNRSQMEETFKNIRSGAIGYET